MLNNRDETKVQDRFGPGAGIPYDYGGSSGSEAETFPNQFSDATGGFNKLRGGADSTKIPSGEGGIGGSRVSPRPRTVVNRPVQSQTTTVRPVTSQAAPSQSAPAPVSARTMSREEAMAELDRATGTGRMDPNATRGPNAVTGTDFGRNVSNTLSALTPIGGGVGKVGVDMAYRGRNAATAAEKFRETANARRAAEGYSPAEALSVLQKGAGKNIKSVGREEVTNPMMWMAGPKNAKNFREAAKDLNKRGTMEEAALEGGMKRGGKVKKMASGGMARSSASSRADGIASRGKTRGKVC
jgi:hypothetical protein